MLLASSQWQQDELLRSEVLHHRHHEGEEGDLGLLGEEDHCLAGVCKLVACEVEAFEALMQTMIFDIRIMAHPDNNESLVAEVLIQ